MLSSRKSRAAVRATADDSTPPQTQILQVKATKSTSSRCQDELRKRTISELGAYNHLYWLVCWLHIIVMLSLGDTSTMPKGFHLCEPEPAQECTEAPAAYDPESLIASAVAKHLCCDSNQCEAISKLASTPHLYVVQVYTPHMQDRALKLLRENYLDENSLKQLENHWTRVWLFKYHRKQTNETVIHVLYQWYTSSIESHSSELSSCHIPLAVAGTVRQYGSPRMNLHLVRVLVLRLHLSGSRPFLAGTIDEELGVFLQPSMQLSLLFMNSRYRYYRSPGSIRIYW
ncbi:hypothetical protein OH76DRAFT_1421448 [Lentinus brumalis]|uniref:Uncharacterized protein n=1 Tax=Lentinus brumalis TaxID=2498619 RepID=A0A371CVP6_9APHY|nr:hypothetical protein OH76DRAFT_1421448 [Polyporus brumalis]